MMLETDGAAQPAAGHAVAEHRGRRVLGYLLAVLTAAGLGVTGTVLAGRMTGHGKAASVSRTVRTAVRSTASLKPLDVDGLTRTVEPALVRITARLSYQGETAEGTGMVLTSGGFVLTNNHVINGATSISVTLAGSGRAFSALVVGDDPGLDVAVLRLSGARRLATVRFGDSARLAVGTEVLALGNAQGHGMKPAVGIISGLNRTIKASDSGAGTTETLTGMEQTSAPIQEGDSGGVLVNRAGQVVGMITAADHPASSGHARGAATIGFAIPVDKARAIARRIIGGRSGAGVRLGTPGFLGVLVAHSDSPDPGRQAAAERRQLAADGSVVPAAASSGCVGSSLDLGLPETVAPARSGILVTGVLCGTAADRAGLRAGDVITSVNGVLVRVPAELGTRLGSRRPGAVAVIGWVTPDGRRRTARIRLGPGPAR